MQVEVKSVTTNLLLKLVYNLRGGSNPFLKAQNYDTQHNQGKVEETVHLKVKYGVQYCTHRRMHSVPKYYVTLPTNRNYLRRELCSSELLGSE